MIKHIAATGKQQGQWVKCSAEKQCRLGGLHVSAEVIKNIQTEFRSHGISVNLSGVTEQDAKAWIEAHPDEISWDSKDREPATIDKIKSIQGRFETLRLVSKKQTLFPQGDEQEEIELQALQAELKTYVEDTAALEGLEEEAGNAKDEALAAFNQDKVAYEKIIGNKKLYSSRQHEAWTPGYAEAAKNILKSERLYNSAVRLSTSIQSHTYRNRKSPSEIGDRIVSLKTNTAIKALPERYLTHSDRFNDVGIDAYNNSVKETMSNEKLSDEERKEHIQALRSGLKETAKFNFQSDVNLTKNSLKNKIADLFERAASHKMPERGAPIIITTGKQKADQDQLRGELKANQVKLSDFFNRFEKAPMHSLITRSSKEQTLRNIR